METYNFDSFQYKGSIDRASQIEDLGNGKKRVIWLKDHDIPHSVDAIIVSSDAGCHDCGDLRSGGLCSPFRSNYAAQALSLAHTQINRSGFLSASLVHIPAAGNPICPLYIGDSAVLPAVLANQGRSRDNINNEFPNSAKMIVGEGI